jgi:hypothetical protein
MAVYPFSYLPDEFKGKRVLITGGFSQAPGICTTIPGKRNSPKPPRLCRRAAILPCNDPAGVSRTVNN